MQGNAIHNVPIASHGGSRTCPPRAIAKTTRAPIGATAIPAPIPPSTAIRMMPQTMPMTAAPRPQNFSAAEPRPFPPHNRGSGRGQHDERQAADHTAPIATGAMTSAETMRRASGDFSKIGASVPAPDPLASSMRRESVRHP